MFVIYTLISILICFINVTNLLPVRLTRQQNFYYISILSILHFVFVPVIPQFTSLFLTISIILFLYKYAENTWLSIFCALFGYFFGIVLNNVLLFFYGKYIDPDVYTKQYPITFMVIFLFVLFAATKLLGWLLHEKLRISRFFCRINFLFFC